MLEYKNTKHHLSLSLRVYKISSHLRWLILNLTFITKTKTNNNFLKYIFFLSTYVFIRYYNFAQGSEEPNSTQSDYIICNSLGICNNVHCKTCVVRQILHICIGIKNLKANLEAHCLRRVVFVS